jgi:hypothetical protein
MATILVTSSIKGINFTTACQETDSFLKMGCGASSQVETNPLPMPVARTNPPPSQPLVKSQPYRNGSPITAVSI